MRILWTSIIAEMGTARNGERKYYYKCRGRKARVNECKKSVVQKDILEKLIMSSTTNKRLHELEQAQQEIERKILIEKSKTTIRYTEKELREYFEQSLRLEPQMLINYFIKEVVLYDDKIQIYYNNPITNSPDYDSLGFLFYSKIIDRNLLETLVIELYV